MAANSLNSLGLFELCIRTESFSILYTCFVKTAATEGSRWVCRGEQGGTDLIWRVMSYPLFSCLLSG